MHRVTHNLALDHLRRESRLRKLHLAAAPRTEPLAPSAHEELDRRESQALLLREIERLTPNERANCEQIQARLAVDVLGEISSHDHDALASHLSGCAVCASEPLGLMRQAVARSGKGERQLAR